LVRALTDNKGQGLKLDVDYTKPNDAWMRQYSLETAIEIYKYSQEKDVITLAKEINAYLYGGDNSI
jgi:hypothetical protein